MMIKKYTLLRPGMRAERAMNLWLSFSLRFLSAMTCSRACKGFLFIEPEAALLVPCPFLLQQYRLFSFQLLSEISDEKFKFLSDSKPISSLGSTTVPDLEFELWKQIIWEEEDDESAFGVGANIWQWAPSAAATFNCFAGLSSTTADGA